MPRHKSTSPQRWQIFLLVLTLGLLFWSAPFLGAALNTVYDALLHWFGVAIFLPGFALGALAWIIWQRKLSLLWRWWNYWIGAVLLAAALFGILALVHLSGEIGGKFVAAPGYVDFLRLLALAIGGAALISPHFTLDALHITARKIRAAPGYFIQGLRYLYSRLPLHKRLFPRRRPLLPQETAPPVPVLEDVAPEPEYESHPHARVRAIPEESQKKGKKKEAAAEGWQLPPLSLLEEAPEIELGQADIEQRAKLIEEALASYGVEAKVMQVNVGPTVTQFGVEPGWEHKYKEMRGKDRNGRLQVRTEEVARTRVRVERITALANDLALALAAPSIRIEAPMPGKPLIGIEVPNSTKGMVTLRGILESSYFRKLQARSPLAIALGKASGGEAVAADLTKMPHLLIAGATGSGKTVCLNTVTTSLLMFNTPDELQLVLIDPKRVEMVNFENAPHLAMPVIVDRDKAVETLNGLNQEMDGRYRKMAVVGARNIEAYNNSSRVARPFPYIVVIIDELADLMMSRPEQVEPAICRLAQLARATGIHLVVATQRPSVDVITGLIKANFPARISFAVASQVDSRTILDTVGAEKLLGRGDMLFLPPEASKSRRLQGCFVSDLEIDKVVKHWAKQRRLKEEAALFITPLSGLDGTPQDPLLEEARRLAKDHKQISSSFLQRQLRIGSGRADQLIALLQREGAAPAEKKVTESSPPQS